jgi:hypothetical protein
MVAQIAPHFNGDDIPSKIGNDTTFSFYKQYSNYNNMKVPNFSIFYSWQSYVGGYANRSYIREKIKSYAKTKVNTLNITIDEDSRGVPGASDIPENILKKIANCDVFVCDITHVDEIITSEGNIRGIPNPNVMFELGFAVRQLGWDRIVCVLNSEYGNMEYLPFDIAKHKIVTYKKRMGIGMLKIH